MAQPIKVSLLQRMFKRKAYPAFPVSSSAGTGGWLSIIREPFTGAWQRNMEQNNQLLHTYHADFACKTLIARDISKLPVHIVEEDDSGVWAKNEKHEYANLMLKPNHYQTRNQFWEQWMLSKLGRGNTYVIKHRDKNGKVIALYVLNPDRVQPLIANDGSVFYRLSSDELSETGDVTVPSTEIIHDRMNTLFNPLIGIPPIYAAGLAALQGLNIQTQSARLFANNATPGGLLKSAGEISDETANRLKSTWEDNYSGSNIGKVAVLGSGLEFQQMTMSAEAAQLIEQLKWSAEVVCSTYHVPPYKIGVGAMPSYNNVQALNVEYYGQCLQSLIEDAEACMNSALGFDDEPKTGIEFEIDNLLRMDSSTQMTVLEQSKNYITPNEGRKRLNLPPTKGGDVVYRQQQDFSLEALAKRDATDNPFNTATPSASANKTEDTTDDDETLVEDEDKISDEDKAMLLAASLRKSLGLGVVQ